MATVAAKQEAIRVILDNLRREQTIELAHTGLGMISERTGASMVTVLKGVAKVIKDETILSSYPPPAIPTVQRTYEDKPAFDASDDIDAVVYELWVICNSGEYRITQEWLIASCKLVRENEKIDPKIADICQEAIEEKNTSPLGLVKSFLKCIEEDIPYDGYLVDDDWLATAASLVQ